MVTDKDSGTYPSTTTDSILERQTSRLSRFISHTEHPDLPDGDEAEHLVGPAPDGGRDAWMCVVGGFFQQFCVFGLMGSNGQLQNYYLKNQLSGYDKSTVAWLGSIQSFIEFAFAMFAGRYFDVHGPRTLVLLATFLGFGSIIGMAFSHEYYQLMLSFIGFGFAGSLIYAPSAAVAAHWFDKRRGFAVGIVACGSGLGGVLYPIMMEQLFAKISYRNTMLVIAGFNLALMLPGAWWMKTRVPPHRPPPWSSMKRPWKERRYVFHVLGAMLFGANILAPYFTCIDYSKINGAPGNVSQYAVTITLSGSIVGRFILGALADVFGVWAVFGCVGFGAATVMFAFWAPPVGFAVSMIGLITYGMISGSWFALLPAATATISPVSEVGMRFGMIVAALAIPSLIGPVVSAALFMNNSYRWTAVWIGACFFLSGLFTNAPPWWAKWQERQAGKSNLSNHSGDTEAGPQHAVTEK